MPVFSIEPLLGLGEFALKACDFPLCHQELRLQVDDGVLIRDSQGLAKEPSDPSYSLYRTARIDRHGSHVNGGSTFVCGAPIDGARAAKIQGD
jgi:hypothetical protein